MPLEEDLRLMALDEEFEAAVIELENVVTHLALVAKSLRRILEVGVLFEIDDEDDDS